MKTRSNSRSISAKLTRMNFIVSATALLLAFASFFAYDSYTFRQSLIRSLATESQIIGANSVSALTFDDPQAAETTLSALQNSPQVLSGAVFNSDDQVFATYTRPGGSEAAITPKLRPGEKTARWVVGGKILLGSRIESRGKAVGSVYILATTSEVFNHARTYGVISMVILFLCLIAALLMTSRFRRILADPLIGLADIANIVSTEKDYSIRAADAGEVQEISVVVSSFNEMLRQIQQQNRDLSEAKEDLERRVEDRTVELTAANKELEAFSYSVAHDLRGPLDVIGNIGFLLSHSELLSNDAAASGQIDELLRGTRKMSTLIGDLLNLSRASRIQLHAKTINLGELAASIIETLQAEEPDRLVKFTIARDAKVVADENLLCIVLDNLLRNAWKYTSKVEFAEIEFGTMDEKNRRVYFVRDNGAGFDPRLSSRLFQPFQRLHTQSEFPGTGIGLATVQRILARHGGRVWAKGETGHGATFFFSM